MSKLSETECSVPDCPRLCRYNKPRNYRSDGEFPVCELHYAQWKEWGEFRVPAWSLSNGRCYVSGCDRKHKARGLCETHNDHQEAGKPLVPLGARKKDRPKNRDLTCEFEDCSRPMYALQRCSRHYSMVRRGKTTLREDYFIGQKCSVPNCLATWSKKYDFKRGHCLRHDRMIHTWNLSHVQVEIIDSIVVCRICGRSGDLMVIDHDHTCCNLGRSGRHCGNCIRGVICSRCNKGLGMFGDDVSIMLNALDYLGQYEVKGSEVLPWNPELQG